MKKLGILLVDDHSVVRMGLTAIINLEKDLHVIGEAENGSEAATRAGELQPDVIVMDLVMPGMDCAEAVARTLKAAPTAKILILTTYGAATEIRYALDAGATGAVTKNLSNTELADAIRRTAAGERVLSPEIKNTLAAAKEEVVLNERQFRIVESISRGLSNQEIATLLGISRTRVKQHLNEVFQALGAANRAEVAALALRKHLLKT